MTSHSKTKKLRPGTCSPEKATEALPQHFTHFGVVLGTDPSNRLSEAVVVTIEKGFHARLGCEPKNITLLKSIKVSKSIVIESRDVGLGGDSSPCLH